jgi:hypothetical protein
LLIVVGLEICDLPTARSSISVVYGLSLLEQSTPMSNKSEFEDHMDKAEDAQRQAESATNEKVAEAWRKIAARYRDLAAMAQSAAMKQRR